MEIEQNAITWDYGNIGMQYDDIKNFHKEKMRTLITLLTMIWNKQGRGEIHITAGKLAEEVILEAVAATGGVVSLTDTIKFDETLNDNVAMIGKQTLYINSDCTIPFMFHTPFSSSSSLNKLVERLRVSIEDNDIPLAIKDCETLLKELKGRANTTLLKMGLPWYV